MTNITSIQTSQTTLGDLVIEMMATQPTWPSQNGQGNLVIDTEPSYSIVIDQIKSNLEKNIPIQIFFVIWQTDTCTWAKGKNILVRNLKLQFFKIFLVCTRLDRRMTFDAEQLKNHIPFYLTTEPKQKEFLDNFDALLQVTKHGYYISAARDISEDKILQGDGWSGFQLYYFDTGQKSEVRGIILSNSCDIAKENERT